MVSVPNFRDFNAAEELMKNIFGFVRTYAYDKNGEQNRQRL